MEHILDLLSESLVITGFVFVMMLVVEYLSVLTRGRADRAVARRGSAQKVICAVLGVSPGCLGAYVVSSLYIHRIITFGSLSAAMIATCGDEAFLLLAVAPVKALQLFATLFVTGIVTAVIIDILNKQKPDQTPISKHAHTAQADLPECVPFSRQQLVEQWRHCTPHRGWLTLMLVLFVAGIGTGRLGHTHVGPEPAHFDTEVCHEEEDHSACQQEVAPHDHAHDHAEHADDPAWDWVRVTLLVVGLLGLAIVSTVPNHFLEAHLWKHLVCVHAWRIFLWIVGAILFTHLLVDRIDIGDAIQSHKSPVLLIALLVGLIPVSGPHLVFVSLFAEGVLPFSALLANAIVQDGHGMLPVLAHDRQAFLRLRAIKLLIGLIMGLGAQAAGF
jgi:hypothetical protein